MVTKPVGAGKGAYGMTAAELEKHLMPAGVSADIAVKKAALSSIVLTYYQQPCFLHVIQLLEASFAI